MTRSLAVVSADPSWAARVKVAAAGLGWTASVFLELEPLLRARARIDLVLLDWQRLGGGLDELKGRAPGIVVILAGEARDMGGRNVAHAIAGGAVDFLPKDLSDAQLRSRLRTRARAHARVAELSTPDGTLKVGEGRVRLRHGGLWRELAPLGPREFSLLRYLLERPGVAHSRAALLEAVWGAKAEKLNPETVDRHVGALRRKLGAAGRSIKTVHGVGYRLD